MKTQAFNFNKIWKYFCILLCCMLLLLPVQGFAQGEDSAGAASVTAEDINATSFALVDSSTGVTILSKDAQNKIYPASTTKIMTALFLIES